MGSIIDSRIDVKIIHRDAGSQEVYEPHARYKYIVNNKSYINNNISFSYEGMTHLHRANRFLNRYYAGGKSIVYYNPKNPDESVLIKGVRTYNYLHMLLWFIASIVMLLIAGSEEVQNKLF